MLKNVLMSIGVIVAVESAVAQMPSSQPTLVNGMAKTFSLAGALDGSGNVPPGTIGILDDQINKLKKLSFAPVDYSLDDYAISVGALVGEGDGIADEISRVIELGEARQKELSDLNALDAELAETEVAYAVADRAAYEGMDVLQDYLEKGGVAADQLAGYPVFNNWLVLHEEIVPRFSDRLQEVRRARKELDVRRTHLHRHNEEASGYLENLKDHLQRIRQKRESQALLKGRDPDRDFLARIEAGAERIGDLSGEIIQSNETVRRRVAAIHARQERAYRDAKLLSGIMNIVEVGIGIAATASTLPASSDTKPTIIVTREEKTIINYILPQQRRLLPPQKPLLLMKR